MPSGPKKRKAAKKKKEKEASHDQIHGGQQSHSAVSQTHENESETEEISSPASQEHPNHQRQFTDGEKEDVEKTEDSSQVKLSSEERKTIDERKDDGAAVGKEVVEDSVEQLESELKPEGAYADSQKELGVGVISQSVHDKSVAKNEREVKISEELGRKNVSFEHDEPQKESSVDVLPQSHNDESHLIVETNVVVYNSPFASSTVNSLSEGLTQVPTPVQVDEVYCSAVESVSDIATYNGGLAGEKVDTDSGIRGDIFLTSNVVISGIEENRKNEKGVSDQNDGSLPIPVDLGLDNKMDEAIVLSNDAQRAPDAENTVTQETEETLMLSYNTPREEAAKCGNTSNGADHIKDSQVHESSDSQPQAASAALPVRRTSWMSCCGLFEVLAGSSR